MMPRIASILVVVGVSAACNAVLDYDKLRQGSDGAAAAEAGQTVKDSSSAEGDLARVPLDAGDNCVAGKGCNVSGKKGLCAAGLTECTSSGAFCKQVNAPVKEKCDGVDQDCDGVAEEKDAQAHAACGRNRYCKKTVSKYVCAAGCFSDDDCSNSNNCDSATNTCYCSAKGKPGCTGGFRCIGDPGKCLCNGQICSTGEICRSGRCVCGSATCHCDSNSTCKKNETCNNGRCDCGSSQGPTAGPFCSSGGECIAGSGSCFSSRDMGVDTGSTRDLGPPQLDGSQSQDAPRSTPDAPPSLPDGSPADM